MNMNDMLRGAGARKRLWAARRMGFLPPPEPELPPSPPPSPSPRPRPAGKVPAGPRQITTWPAGDFIRQIRRRLRKEHTAMAYETSARAKQLAEGLPAAAITLPAEISSAIRAYDAAAQMALPAASRPGQATAAAIA